jgi:hypothetical protein
VGVSGNRRCSVGHGCRPSNPISGHPYSCDPKARNPRDLIERMFCRLDDFTGFAIRQQELAKAVAIGVKWQDIFPSCREIAGRKPISGAHRMPATMV